MMFCPVNPYTKQNKKSKVEIQHIFGQSQNNTFLAQSLFAVPCPALQPAPAPGLGFCARWRQSRRGWQGGLRNRN